MFGQIRRPRFECTIPMYCKFSLPTPQYVVHSCALFIVVVKFSRYVQYWSSMTDKATIDCYK